ncbi:MAG: glutamate ABC transporter substrate-binding protein [Microlunatus sp.]|nr:glutamate ABC transporter substrate-binding protein [Microlunatus sp.]MDN5804027.1 glutamate ABC transporter substrate-binding protein [Microlunatus sp.]
MRSRLRRAAQRHTRVAEALLVTLLIGVLAGCGLTAYAPTPLPSPTVPESTPSTGPPPVPPVECDDALASYRPSDTAGPAVKRIKDRGRIIAGVSADTYLLGSRNPFSGKIEGFDIDLVKAMAKAILGDENAYELKVITAAQRIPSLQAGDVDMVARNMTINCERWSEVAFSSEYYRSGQKILVRRGSKDTTLADLAGQRVCAPKATSSMTNLKKLQPEAIAVGSDNHTGCLVLFQNGEVDAITGDDTVLAGLAAQDPYAVVPEQKAFTAEPYGLGFNRDDVDLVRYANGVLAKMRSDGQWRRIYNRWLAEALGPAPAPPKAVYGRTR